MSAQIQVIEIVYELYNFGGLSQEPPNEQIMRLTLKRNNKVKETHSMKH